MNITLNLATRPYIELRSVFARLRLLGLFLLLAGIPMLLVLRGVEGRARAAEARVAALHQQTEQLREQQARARALALEGPNAALIREIDYLNTTFRRKAFSWTATIVDLEEVLPYGVQVRGLEPLALPDGRVLIRLRVDGPRDKGVEVVRNLEHSRHFLAPHLVQETEASQQSGAARMETASTGAEPLEQFDILADYRPLSQTETRPVPVAVMQAAPAAAAGTRPRRKARKPMPGAAGGIR